MPASAMSRLALASTLHGLAWPNPHAVVCSQGHSSISLTVVRARDVAGGNTAVQTDHSHLPATRSSSVVPSRGVRARALCADRSVAGASKPHSRTQSVVLDVCTGELRVIFDTTQPTCSVGVLVGTFGRPGSSKGSGFEGSVPTYG